mmetsp:Transcript_21389/g.26453  ORF Transcript_21389/g.26453 Transcript_21389/m.26453 type:complete len:335 (+) Transcript_21389:84-1088(+)|eukprot:CAMPEP_0172490838 /NCGR_PEP_ID=MMETSP1066-20121228/21414_1 /TAXON_ID=671091 /ORGANISM="Coscinodiscus wailesii, Strain CCMP2513" /LENGTH=334 /DNA_ID=CAMNT_0013259517 /DNA_START=84 /DNA_END=1088 /DNA_ORIENTATION=-
MTTKETKSNIPPQGNAPTSLIRNGWFTETESLWHGQKFSLALENFSEESILYSEQSEFQSILVFKSVKYGNVLVLDGVLQLTEKDEFSFHEMLVHTPLFSHSAPRNILLVGGGDGGALREVCRHPDVENITVVEIDPRVVSVTKRFFSTTMSFSFSDPRVTIVYDDAAAFLEKDESKYCYDVIIADSSDPVGPAETLFQPRFYEAMSEALRPGGVICAVGESMWTHLDLIGDIVACCADIFDSAEYATTMVPSYPCGQIGFVIAGKGRETRRMPLREPSSEMQSSLKWYNSAIHRAAFVLPQFLKEKLGDAFEDDDDGDDDDAADKCFAPCTIS